MLVYNSKHLKGWLRVQLAPCRPRDSSACTMHFGATVQATEHKQYGKNWENMKEPAFIEQKVLVASSAAPVYFLLKFIAPED